MDNKKRILRFCTLLIIFINIKVWGEFASGLHENRSVIIQREHNSLCGYDSVYVLLCLFDKNYDKKKLRDMVYSEGGKYSSLENIKRIIDSAGLHSLAVKGQKWHTILPNAIGIGYRRNTGEKIGDFYLFKKRGKDILLFLPPDRIYTVEADAFITRTNQGHALLVFRDKWQKYWTLAKLSVRNYIFIISFVGALIVAMCVTYMFFKFRNNKDRNIKLVCGASASLAGYFALLCICGHYYKSPVMMSDGLVVIAHKRKIDLGCGNKGEKKNFEFSVRNVGEKPIAINKVIASCSCLSFDFQEGTVNPNDTYTIKATYKYPESGELNAYVYLVYNGGNSVEKVLISGRNCKMATIDKQRLYFGRLQKNTCIKKNIMLRCFIDKEGYFPPLKRLRTSTFWLNAGSEEIEEQRFKGFKSYRITVSIFGDIAPLGIFEEKVYIYLDDPDAKEVEIEVYGQVI